MKSQTGLFDELSEAIQLAGTLTVLHTNAVASHVGLSATEFEAVDIIRNNQPMTAGKMSEYCGLTTGAITGLVDRLERANFVRRQRDETDRRRVFIVPVEDKARDKKIRELYRPLSDWFEEFFEKYSDEEIRLLLEMQKEANEKTIASIRTLRAKKR